METLKVKLQIQYEVNKVDRQFSGPIDCIRKILKQQGVLGLYNGFLGTIAFRSNFMFLYGSFEGS
jgi:solute carrier family 25 (mitochondrial carnitine/acylcarnitine transporter), member 20/29